AVDPARARCTAVLVSVTVAPSVTETGAVTVAVAVTVRPFPAVAVAVRVAVASARAVAVARRVAAIGMRTDAVAVPAGQEPGRELGAAPSWLEPSPVGSAATRAPRPKAKAASAGRTIPMGRRRAVRRRRRMRRP